MSIPHITMQTGHVRHIEAGEVIGETLARVRPWLRVLVDTGEQMPLPVNLLAHYTARVAVEDDMLLLSLFSPARRDTGSTPLVTIGLVRSAEHAPVMWGLLTSSQMPPVAPEATMPAAPYCGVILWPTITLDPAAVGWLGDFERCVAWAWLGV